MNAKATIPLFSVIIPTYNRANLLKRAMRSVLGQSFQNWELIVVDDGSTDETASVVQSFLDDRIVYFFQENKELNGARNAGIRLAKGTYLCFLDDDDYYLENHFLELVKFAETQKFPMGVLKTGSFLKIRGILKKLPNFNSTKFTSPIEYVLTNPVNLLPLAIHRTIFKEEVFDENFLLYEDLHFLVRVLLKYPLLQLENYSTVYVTHDSARSVTYYQSKEKVANLFACLEDLFEKYGKEIALHTHPKIKNQMLALQYNDFANKVASQGNLKVMIRYLATAIKYKIDLKFAVIYLRTVIRAFLKNFF